MVLPLLAVGAMFVIGGLLIRPRSRPDEVQTTGTVVESGSGYALGDPAWVCTIEFADADGTARRFEPPLTSARRRAVGTPVAVAYSPSDPAGTARKADGLDGALHWVVTGVGAVLILAGLGARLAAHDVRLAERPRDRSSGPPTVAAGGYYCGLEVTWPTASGAG